MVVRFASFETTSSGLRKLSEAFLFLLKPKGYWIALHGMCGPDDPHHRTLATETSYAPSKMVFFLFINGQGIIVLRLRTRALSYLKEVSWIFFALKRLIATKS